MKKIWIFFLCAFGATIQLHPNVIGQHILDRFCPTDFEELPISDWNHPTIDDFQLIENYLRLRQNRIGIDLQQHSFVHPNQLDGLISYRIGRVKITNGTDPRFIRVDFGNDPHQRECCIISYAGCDFGGRHYENGLITLIKALEKIHFEGHLIYRVGGWPSLSKGRLHYADVPYAFKPFLFEEVRDMGYKYILWLDVCCIPLRDLSPIFSHIKKHGYCYLSQGTISNNTLQDWDYVRESVDAAKREHYTDVNTQIVGISSFHPIGSSLLDEWIDAACKKLPFLNPTADQLCFSMLINKYDLHDGRLPNSIKYESSTNNFRFLNTKCRAYFLHNYIFVDTTFQAGADLFHRIPLTGFTRPF